MTEENGRISNELIYRVLQSVQEQTATIAATVKGHDRRFDSIVRSFNGLRMDIADQTPAQ